MSFWPTGPRPNAANMNWSILVYGVIIVVSLIYFYFRGRHVYAGPVEYVRKSA
jgi:choline transport protein